MLKINETHVDVYYTHYDQRWKVEVKYLKRNKLRGDCYWVTKHLRSYENKKYAELFASRFS